VPKASYAIGKKDQLSNMQLDDEDANGVAGSDDEPATAERSSRLRQAVRAAGGNKAVAGRADMPVGTLNRYIAGRDMKASALVALARAAGVRLEWLATGEGPMHAAEAGLLDAGGELAGDDTSPGVRQQLVTMGRPGVAPPGYVLLPRVEARAAAGHGSGLGSDQVVDFLAFSEDWVRNTLHRRPANLALLEATGDSMDPTIRDGDILLVDTSVTDIQSSRVYVLQVNGALLVKRIQVRLDGSLVVKSDNPSYEAEVVRPDERSPLRIVGQVVWQAGPVRS
jgi:phage repressor protein C with HTH and peptisase S24 domain